MPAPKQNPALIAAAITALRVAKAAKAAKAAKVIAKKPVTKVQPKTNTKVANPKSNVKVVNPKSNSNVKVITNSTAKRQESYQDWLKTFGPAKNKALANSARGKTQTPTAAAARRRNINE